MLRPLDLCGPMIAVRSHGNPYGVVTASFGLVLLTRDAAAIGAHDVYALADKLLYQAKHAGRNRVVAQSL